MLEWEREDQSVQVSSFTSFNQVYRTRPGFPLHTYVFDDHTLRECNKERGYKSMSSNQTTSRFAASLSAYDCSSPSIQIDLQQMMNVHHVRQALSLLDCLHLSLCASTLCVQRCRCCSAADLLRFSDCEGRRRAAEAAEAAELSQWYSTPPKHTALVLLAALCSLQNMKEVKEIWMMFVDLITAWMHKYFFQRDFHIVALRVRVATVIWSWHVASEIWLCRDEYSTIG